MSGTSPSAAQPNDTAAFEQLWQAIRAGQSTQYRQLVGECTPHLLNVVRKRLSRRLRPRFDSIDFAQAVWLSFVAQMDRLPRFATVQELHNYLADMASYKVIDEVRRHHKCQSRDIVRETPLQSCEPEAEASPLAQCHSTPSQVAIAHERLERLKTGRPAAHQQIIQLRYEGESVPEIAHAVGYSERQVRRILLQLETELKAADARLCR